MKSSTVVKPRKTMNFRQLWFLHWIMSFIYLVLFIAGTTMTRLPNGVFIRNPLYDFHKSMGVIAMALLSWRIWLLLRVYIGKYKKRSPKFSLNWWRTFALHTSLYVLMFAVPMSGFFLSNSFRSNNVSFFGILVPDIFPVNSAMVGLGRNLHFWLAYGFLSFIVLHGLNQRKFLQNLWQRNFWQKTQAKAKTIDIN